MFIGHFAMGFGAKRFAPEVSLGVLFLACQLADLIWPNLVLLGIEHLSIEPGATVNGSRGMVCPGHVVDRCLGLLD